MNRGDWKRETEEDNSTNGKQASTQWLRKNVGALWDKGGMAMHESGKEGERGQIKVKRKDIVLSPEQVARQSPSGLHAQLQTLSWCPTDFKRCTLVRNERNKSQTSTRIDERGKRTFEGVKQSYLARICHVSDSIPVSVCKRTFSAKR